MKKTELALQYLPYYTAHSAVNLLMSWISQSPTLLAALAKTGYRKTQKELTPAQVRLIIDHLGEP